MIRIVTSFLLCIFIVQSMSFELKYNEMSQDSQDPDLCGNDPRPDAVITLDNDVVFFQGKHFFRRPCYGCRFQATPLREQWVNAPENIDAAFMSVTLGNLTCFFKGAHIWAYDEKYSLVEGYPKMIEDDFPGIPDGLTAATNHIWNGELHDYFFKGNDYYYNRQEQESPFEWNGIPQTIEIDAAFHFEDGFTYLFTGDLYYKFDPKTQAVVEADPPYPRSTAKAWYACET